ncbi:hypothetical protein Pst134EB_028734 [Puccinia striiformis f. sp. tritici]|nr:hypothetical protein Pst134EB_028734 [Puccinia striiformis f. sp. tritici]
MARLGLIWLKIVLCHFHWAIAAPAEELLLRKDPINLKGDNADLFQGLDFDFLGSPSRSQRPKRLAEEFDFSYDPESDPLGLFAPMGLPPPTYSVSSPSEEHGTRYGSMESILDQESESRRSKGTGSNKKPRVDQPIQPPTDQVPVQTQEFESHFSEGNGSNKKRKAHQPTQPSSKQASVQSPVQTESPVDDSDSEWEQKEQARLSKSKMTLGSDVRYFGTRDTMHTLIRRARNSLDYRNNLQAEELTQITDLINLKVDDMFALYQHSPILSDDLKVGGLDIVLRRTSRAHSEGDRLNYNVNIRLPLKFPNSGDKTKPIFLKIHLIGKALHEFHNLVRLNGLDEIILGGDRKFHEGPLQWYYDLIFTDTPDHLPLLGWAQTFLPIEHGDKTFNEAQIILYKALTKSRRMSGNVAGIAALNLLEIWYKTQHLIHYKVALPDQQYSHLIVQAVQKHSPGNRITYIDLPPIS